MATKNTNTKVQATEATKKAEAPKQKHFCMNCGKEFEAASAFIRYCPECAAQKKAAQKKKQKGYAKERNARLGLTNISIYKTDKEKLAAQAKEQNTMMAEIIKALLAKA